MANDNIFETGVYTPGMDELSTKGSNKLLNIIFIIDVSGSMILQTNGKSRIEAVNDALTQMIPALRQVQIDCMSKFELRISIMTFDYDARWIVDPTPIMEYNHEDIDCSKYQTMYGKAFDKLNEKLTRSEFMAHVGKIAAPYIMFLTDGEPTDVGDYEAAIDRLLKNGWFVKSQRFAVLMGDEAINNDLARRAVSRFVSDPVEGIIDAADAATIAAEVQAKTLHTIEVQTRHAVADEESDTEEGSNEGSNNNAGNNGGGFGGFGDFDPKKDINDGDIIFV
ncbi:MAG: VWA domain-containing protein [Lachnospiraceae bacterium]|nr:VWA domain-containing protein [Lachnospiraceae bacterium]